MPGTPLPITVVIAPLDPDLSYTPQELADAIAERLSFETQEALALFGIGDVLPTSDEGPFLLNGTTWYVWSEIDGQYVPQTIEFKVDLNPKPFRANLNANQVVTFAGAGSEVVDLVYNEVWDPDGVFAGSTFIAPNDGFYHIDAKVSVASTSGSPTDTIVIFYPKKNGFQMASEQVFVEVTNPQIGRTYQVSTNIQLSAGDAITMAVGIQIGGGSGDFTVFAQDSWISGFKIRNLTF